MLVYSTEQKMDDYHGDSLGWAKTIYITRVINDWIFSPSAEDIVDNQI